MKKICLISSWIFKRINNVIKSEEIPTLACWDDFVLWGGGGLKKVLGYIPSLHAVARHLIEGGWFWRDKLE